MSIITATKTTTFAKLASTSRAGGHPLRAMQVTSANVLCKDLARSYEVRGVASGQLVVLQAQERGIGQVRLTQGQATRLPSRNDLQDLEVALANYSRAKDFNPPPGVAEVRIAIAEALNGAAPMANFKVTSARDTGRWLNLSGGFTGAPKDTADVAFDTVNRRLLLLYQVNASSARQRPMTASELRGLVQALANHGGSAVERTIVEAARRALVIS
jgi:hypothetical protein